jgi:transposase
MRSAYCALRPCFCRLKDFRRIATRYDKLARNFFSALCFVATLAYWL